MTTSQSSEREIRAQVSKIVIALKTRDWPLGKGTVTFGIVMDDKVIKVTIPIEKIKESSGIELGEMIYGYMKGETQQ